MNDKTTALPELPPLPNASYAGIFTPEQMYAYAREAIALTAAGAGGEVEVWGVFDADGGLLEVFKSQAGADSWLQWDRTRTVRLLGTYTTPPPAPDGDAVAEVIENRVGVELVWSKPPSAGRPPVGTKLYTRPAPDMAALVEKWREQADRLELCALEADSIGLKGAADFNEARARLLRECADEAAALQAQDGG